MIYPKSIEKGDFIAVTAPSMGITDSKKILKYENAIKNIKNMGYNFIETKNVRTNEMGRSSSASIRAEQFMEIWENEQVSSIICADGGDFACEMLDYLDFDTLSKLEPKWVHGFSDITNLGFVITTNLDIATIYGENIRDFGMSELFKCLTDSFKLMQGEEVVQESFGACEPWDLKKEKKEGQGDIFSSYNLEKKYHWKNLYDEEELKFSGRCIGGCFDVIINLIGTEYDKVKEYIQKYKNDGIIWFFDIFEMSTPNVFCHLWQMKNAGYFENCNGIIFGRPAMLREDYEMSLVNVVKDSIGEMKIPVILDADIGHVPPQMPIVNGAILEVTSKGGKGIIKTFLK